MEHHIYINSKDREDRDNTSPANFRIKLYKEVNPKCAELSYALIPNTFYNITSVNKNYGFNMVQQTIPEGCYTLNELLQYIANQTALTIAYDDITNNITISSNVDFSLDFSNTELGGMLGFQKRGYAEQPTYTAEFGPRAYCSAIFIDTNLGSGVINSGDHQNSTFTIPVNVNKSEIIQFYSKTQFSISPKVRENGIQFLEIKLRDEYGQILSGLSDWSCMIKLYY